MTAVEWLVENYLPLKRGLELKNDLHIRLVEEAKQMEKQQQIDFATDFARDYIGFTSVSTDANDLGPAARYYNQKHDK